MAREYQTEAEKTWCPGCGNFGILNAVTSAIPKLEEKGIPPENLAISAGIGCHAKIFDYLKVGGLYSLHGRDIATVEGMKFANPDLKVITFSGDGNGMGEGFAHTMFAAKRNADVTMILHNNSVYALTTGQFTPLTPKGWEGPSTPRGSIEKPFNPITLILEAGATFVARGFSGKVNHLADLIVQAVQHEGFSFIEVFQPAVPYHDWDEYRDRVEVLEKKLETYDEAMEYAKRDKWYIGLYYRENRPVYHTQLYGDHNPVTKRKSRDDRIKLLKKKFNL